ncbi:MAG: YceI family protein [Pseudomonadota bacterium]
MFNAQRFTGFFAAALIASTPLLAAPAAAQSADAPSGAYNLDPTHASVVFKVAHLGLSDYTARFTKFDIALNLDAENPANSTVTATIDPSSVETEYPGATDFNGEIANDAKFLNAGQFPEITFTSTSVEPTGDNTAKVTGDLSMLGATQPVTLDVVLNGALANHPFAKKPAVGFTATGEFDRTVWGMAHLTNTLGADGPAIVSPTVSFEIQAEFIKAE